MTESTTENTTADHDFANADANHAPLDRLLAYLDNRNPTVEQAREVFQPLTIGEYENVHIAALLATIRTRGETFADIAGAAQAFINAARPFPITGAGLLDTAGTGGDGTNTINISTAATVRCRHVPVPPMSWKPSISRWTWMWIVQLPNSRILASPSYSPRRIIRRSRT